MKYVIVVIEITGKVNSQCFKANKSSCCCVIAYFISSGDK